VNLRAEMQAPLSRFVRQVSSICYDLQNHVDRFETVSKQISEYKDLLYGIMEYQSMQASKAFALEARASAKRMEDMTEKMQDMTLKTTLETVLMRIITVVTVFFLPGTFVCTLLSTSIVTFEAKDSSISSGATSLGALKLFFCITFSLMFATFGVGYVLYWWALRYGAK
jgi:hypothetical protein